MIYGLVFIAGVVAGAFALARWYVWRLNDIDVARSILKSVYRKAHPHWLQRSQDDTRQVCPVCGWSEAETLASPTAPCTSEAAYAAKH